jgi:hypothetical protein
MTAAQASIPAANGVISACYDKTGGTVRIIDAAKQNCKSARSSSPGTRPDLQGPAGPQGIQGVKGDTGALGTGRPAPPGRRSYRPAGADGTDGVDGAVGPAGPRGATAQLAPMAPTVLREPMALMARLAKRSRWRGRCCGADGADGAVGAKGDRVTPAHRRSGHPGRNRSGWPDGPQGEMGRPALLAPTGPTVRRALTVRTALRAPG